MPCDHTRLVGCQENFMPSLSPAQLQDITKRAHHCNCCKTHDGIHYKTLCLSLFGPMTQRCPFEASELGTTDPIQALPPQTTLQSHALVASPSFGINLCPNLMKASCVLLVPAAPSFAFMKVLLVLLMRLQCLRMSKNLRKTSTSLMLVMMTSPPFPELMDPSTQMT